MPTTSTEPNEFDLDGDGIVSEKDMAMAERILVAENDNKKEDAQRNMTWYALAGLLLYPSLIVGCELVGLDGASKILGDMAPTYFVAVAGIVAAFFGSQAFSKGK